MSEWRRFSRLPESTEYWEQLTARMQRATHDGVALPQTQVRSLAPLAWTAFAAALAATIASVWLPPTRSVATPPTLLVPSDSIGAVWVARSGPPDMAEVLMNRMRGPQ